MTFFTTIETIASIFSAAIFGAIFAVLDMILKIFSLELRHVTKIKEHIFDSDRLLAIPKRETDFNDKKARCGLWGEIAAFFKIALFSLGFILLSYYALDGAIRVYLLIFAIAFFLLFRYASDVSLLKAAHSVFLFIWGVFIVSLRLILKPLALLIRKIGKSVLKRPDR